MLLVLTIVLALSCFGMTALLYTKHRELSTGRIIFAPVRAPLTRSASWLTSALITRAPGVIARAAENGIALSRALARSALARLVIATERLLERSLEALRRSFAPARAAGEPSNFLREVAEEKRKLTRTARPRRPAPDTSREPPPALE